MIEFAVIIPDSQWQPKSWSWLHYKQNNIWYYKGDNMMFYGAEYMVNENYYIYPLFEFNP